jgi:hypothetical protein
MSDDYRSDAGGREGLIDDRHLLLIGPGPGPGLGAAVAGRSSTQTVLGRRSSASRGSRRSRRDSVALARPLRCPSAKPLLLS